MKLAKLFCLTFVAIALSACEAVNTPDGKIPADYVSFAKPWMGSYRGTFEGKPSELKLEMKDGLVSVTYTDQNGTDILAPGCGSQIGRLERIMVSSSGLAGEPQVEQAVFAFSPGVCKILGRELVLVFSSDSQSKAALAHVWIEQSQKEVYHPEPCHHSPGAMENCSVEYNHIVVNYIQGDYKKSN